MTFDQHQMPRGWQAMDKFLELEWQTCLDVGAGDGEHATAMREAGRKVTTIDAISRGEGGPDIEGDYMDAEFPAPFDAIWCSHVLEHQRNPGRFLDKIGDDLADDGVIAITVPPLKHQIVGGHVSLWNPGLLVYHLILAGFDCSKAAVGAYGYNISVVVRRVPVPTDSGIADLTSGPGDIEKLLPFWPEAWDAKQGFDGLQSARWV